MTLTAHLGEAVDIYPALAPGYPLIVSDGAYGIGGFPGDPTDPRRLADWYAPHLDAWDRLAAPSSSLYFWGTPEGCARMLPAIEAAGWTFRSRIVWDKGPVRGMGSPSMRAWPPATEDCYFYVREEWDPLSAATELRAAGRRPEALDRALGVSCVASRKYLGSDRQAYPPTDADLEVLRRAFPDVAAFAPATVRYPFTLPAGVTDVWAGLPVDRPERHGCAKRDDHIERIVLASSRPGDRVLEPFGGGAPVLRACRKLGRSCDSIERDPEWHARAAASIEARPDLTATPHQPSLFGSVQG